MKILAVGDFHGEFPKKFEKLIKKKEIDLVVSVGDYMPFSLRKLFFKHIYHADNDKELWDYIGKKKYKEMQMRDVRSGEMVLKKMQKLPVRVFTVVGNNDRTKWPEAINEEHFLRRKEKKWNWATQDFFTNAIARYSNIVDIDYSYARFGDFIFIGGGPSSFPGQIKSKNYRKMKKMIERSFRKFSKENRNRKVIFVSHNVPYKTKLDKITSKEAHALVKNEHYGDKLVRKIIEKWKPILHLGGHIHEGMGKQKISKTLCVNVGASHEGEASIIEINGKGKIEVKFIR